MSESVPELLARIRKENESVIQLKTFVKNTISAAEGEKVFRLINKHLVKKNEIVFSFKDIYNMSNEFLDSAFGQALDAYGEDVFKEHIKFKIYKINLSIFFNSYIEQYIKKQSN